MAVFLVTAGLQALLSMLPPRIVALPAGMSIESAHLLLELFAIIVATQIAAVSWHTFDHQTTSFPQILIAGFAVIATCDLMHTLTFARMPQFLGAETAEYPIFFALTSRSFEVVTLALVATGRVPRFSRSTALGLGLLVATAVAWFGLYRQDLFPTLYVAGQGVTPFKAGYELSLSVLNIAVAIYLFRKARRAGEPRLFLLASAAWIMAMSGLPLVSYTTHADVGVFHGHLYKIAAYALMYRAAVITSLHAPFEALVRSEKRARESECRIRSLSDHLPNSVVYQIVREKDGTMRFLHISESVVELTGISAAEIFRDASAMERAMREEDRIAIGKALKTSAETMQVFDVEVCLQHRDGRLRWKHLLSSPRWLDDGRICWDGIQTDITERRALEKKDRENEAMLAAVIDSASDAVISVDAGRRITLFNPAAERIFGHAASDLLGQKLHRLLPARSREHCDRDLASFLASDVPSQGKGQLTGVRADGAELTLEASISRVTVNDKQVLTAILRDVTDRSRAEQALRQSQHELTELTRQLMAQEKATSSRLAQVLHDQLGQTLTAIRIDFVSEARFADADESARHARVDRLIDQAVREVREVLVELRPTLLDERGLFEALHNELSTRRASTDRISLRLDALGDLETQRWSPDVEYAAFMVAREAIANAIRHARATLIRVSLSGGPEALHLQVADNGVGLAADAMTVRPGHLGMVGMRERSIAIGALFEARSSPGGGTTVKLAWEGSEA
ncbi:MASE3 domain-containing protein [Variovorax sp. Sphag1AA]|uniref:MASE3 domain-containing protein n=1 Tax=Variovorax sp. Sphag1AA TaxID=2587027 RepID=UPI00161AA7DA|nr:MASE3 domain-containing protein [Variovorax sp. Sphag1AA]MBB3178694.1 PAS domain S-box-containing protein [Variovorax sp. Sphag1AA]